MILLTWNVDGTKRLKLTGKSEKMLKLIETNKMYAFM